MPMATHRSCHCDRREQSREFKVEACANVLKCLKCADPALLPTVAMIKNQPLYLQKKYKWHKLADSENEISFRENDMALVEVNGKQVALGRYRDRLFAFAYGCPHAGGLLTDGWIDPKGNIVCPVHHYRFSIENGRNITGEGYHLKHWPVEKRADGIFVGFEEGGLFKLL